MNQQVLISVIIPVYKVEKYLDQCVESVVSQTYHNLEILLIDDGSPDRCPEMCNAWAQKDSRIKVTHKKNGGVSDARNVGIENFNGEYVLFVDSDDIIACDLVDELYRICKRENVKLAMSPVWEFSNAKMLSKNVLHGGFNLFNGRFICNHFFDFDASGLLAKLYHKSLVKNARFILNRRVGEDVAFNFHIFFSQEKIACIRKSMYFYRRYAESTMGSYNICLLDELLTFEELLLFCQEKKEMELYNSLIMEYFMRILAHENNIKKFLKGDKALLDALKEKKYSLFDAISSVRVRIKLFWVGLFPKLSLKVFFMCRRFRQERLRKK